MMMPSASRACAISRSRLRWILVPLALLTTGKVCTHHSLAAYKVPAKLWWVHTFPVVNSANGTKIQRNRLREMAQARLAEGIIIDTLTQEKLP